MTTPMTGPAIDPGTGYIYREFIPIDVPGGVASFEGSGADTATILMQAASEATDIYAQSVQSLVNAVPGSRHDVYCRGGVQPVRSTITSRTDIYLDYCMPTTPVFTGVYGIGGDGWVPILIPDSMCDAQGWT